MDDTNTNPIPPAEPNPPVEPTPPTPAEPPVSPVSPTPPQPEPTPTPVSPTPEITSAPEATPTLASPIPEPTSIPTAPISPQQEPTPVQPAPQTVAQSEPTQPAADPNQEELIKLFVGKNYDKISKHFYNFPAFFFTSYYLLYRKLYISGIIFFILETIISIALLFVNPLVSFITILVIHLICCFIFNKYYLWCINRKIAQFKAEQPEATFETLKGLCSAKGGTSTVALIVGILVESTITGIAMSIAMVNGLISLFTSISEQTNVANPDDSSIIQSETDNGPIESLDTETTISDFITVEIPEGFIKSSETNDSQLSYYYPEDDDSVRGSCSFILNMPTGYDDANAVLRAAIDELYPGNEGEDTLPQIKSTKLHSHTWYWFSTESIDSDNYYYATDFAGHTFFIEFDSGLFAPSECRTFRSTILNSLEPVEQNLIRDN